MLVANSLDPIAARIDQKSCIVGWMVFIAKAGRSIVGATIRNTGLPKRIHRRAIRCFETPMARTIDYNRFAVPYRQISELGIIAITTLTVSGACLRPAHLRYADGRHDGIVEPFCLVEI